MTNKERLTKLIKSEGHVLEVYDSIIDELNGRWIKEVKDELQFMDTTDVDVKLNRRPYVVEISIVDDEVDLRMITKNEYINLYGDERYN